MNYIDRLILNCKAAKEAVPFNEFIFQDLDSLKQVKYAIYITEDLSGDPEKTFQDYAAFKDKKERSCARLNKPSTVMYVGSSTTNLKSRINQHLGGGYANTYALHLDHWFEGQYQITIREYDVPKEVLQIIEDALSDQLKPAFGKQGANNK